MKLHNSFFCLLALAATLAGCGQLPGQLTSKSSNTSVLASNKCQHPWVFSDLGAGTLIDTSKYDFDHDSGEITPAPGALSYLAALANSGYTLGLIVNVPDDWGKDDDAKIFKVIDMIDHAWVTPVPLNWALFGEISGTGDKRHFAGRFLVSDRDEHRKPDPFLFKKAVKLAGGCATFYMSTISYEIPAAAAAGMAAYRIVNHRYLPVEQIDEYVANH